MSITGTLDSSRRLQKAGVPPQQAEVFSELLEETAKATQQDLKAFIVEQITSLEMRLDARITQSEARTAAAIAQSESRMESRISQVEARLLREMRQQVIWIVGLLLGFGTAILGVVKLLFF